MPTWPAAIKLMKLASNQAWQLLIGQIDFIPHVQNIFERPSRISFEGDMVGCDRGNLRKKRFRPCCRPVLLPDEPKHTTSGRRHGNPGEQTTLRNLKRDMHEQTLDGSGRKLRYRADFGLCSESALHH
jgi:hypothetical protein